MVLGDTLCDVVLQRPVTHARHSFCYLAFNGPSRLCLFDSATLPRCVHFIGEHSVLAQGTDVPFPPFETHLGFDCCVLLLVTACWLHFAYHKSPHGIPERWRGADVRWERH